MKHIISFVSFATGNDITKAWNG